MIFSSICTIKRLAVGLRPDSVEELTALHRSLHEFKLPKKEGEREKGREGTGS